MKCCEYGPCFTKLTILNLEVRQNKLERLFFAVFSGYLDICESIYAATYEVEHTKSPWPENIKQV